MSVWGDHPVYWVIDWIVDEMEARDIINKSDYITDLSDRNSENFEVPIFSPAQQTPEVTTMFNEGKFVDAPFFIYDVTSYFNPEMPYVKTQDLATIMYCNDVDKMMEIVNFIEDLCGRSHWSAADYNRHYSQDDEHPYEMKAVWIDNASGPQEVLDEGGRYAYIITIRYDVVHEGPGRAEHFSEVKKAYPFSDVGMLDD